MISYETFKLSELRLDENNYRTGPVESQREAILAIINDQRDKLVNLAKDILAEGAISPGELTWVTRSPDSGYIVIEGNRRVTALKLMETPTLADGTVIDREFRVLAQEFAKSPIRELFACVFPTYESAETWRRKRHLNTSSGVGLEPWSTQAKARADRDHGVKSRRSLAVFEYLADNSADWAAISAALDNRWTTVERVLNAGPMKSVLGIHIDQQTGGITFENGNEASGRKVLKAVLSAMANTSFKFEEVEKKENREAFLGRFAGMSVKPSAARAAPAQGTALPVPTAPVAPTSALPAPLPRPKGEKSRTSLAPKTGKRVFGVQGNRLNKLYLECRNLAVSTNENAAALLLRVFIELSTDALLDEKAVPLPSSAGKKNITRWDDFGVSLTMKVSCALAHLDPGGKSKTFQAVRVALSSQSHSPAAIFTLNGYFHNRQLMPQASDVMAAWDAWEPYLRELHGAR